MHGVVRSEQRTDDVADAVRNTEQIVDLAVNHKYGKREGCCDEYNESLYGVCRHDIHLHRPQRDGEYQIPDADVYVSAVETYEQKPQIVPRTNLYVVSLFDFDAVVENQVEENDDEYHAKTYLEHLFVNGCCHERARDVAYDDRNRQQKTVPQIEHSFADEGYGRCEVLEEYGDAVCSVGNGYGQTECREHRNGHNRATAGQRIDNADDNA